MNWPITMILATAAIVVGGPRLMRVLGVDEATRAASTVIAMAAAWAVAAVMGFVPLLATLLAFFFAAVGAWSWRTAVKQRRGHAEAQARAQRTDAKVDGE